MGDLLITVHNKSIAGKSTGASVPIAFINANEKLKGSLVPFNPAPIVSGIYKTSMYFFFSATSPARDVA